MQKKSTFFLPGIFLLILFYFNIGCASAQEVTIKDSRHYSHILGEYRDFRIFLPPGYEENSDKRYPVIYFFHGWSQRYFGSASGNEYAEYDKGDDNNGDNIANFVADHEVIVVKADGYNRDPGEEYYLRPWNVSPVETYRQFPIYFPELVDHIDANYQTIPNRQNRAISGLSMGGFMTFWIGGKYPHLVSAAGSFCGSPEFVAGPKNFPVEYRHIDMYKNYRGVNLRLNYGNEDFIRFYHRDMNHFWPYVMENYEYEVYDAAHSTAGLGEMFDFFMKTFVNPPEKPDRWHHIDVYPEFSVWGYEVTSDRMVPGFTILEDVTKNGFKTSVRKHMPDGEILPFVNVKVTTPPIYEKNASYIVNDFNLRKNQVEQYTVISDSEGKISLELNGSANAIGINKGEKQPNITLKGYQIANLQWAKAKNDVEISMELLNKGLAEAKRVTASITATNQNTEVKKSEVDFGKISPGEIQKGKGTFTFRVDENLPVTKFKLQFQDNEGRVWEEFLEIPLRNDHAEWEDFVVADGKTFQVSQAGTDTANIFLGKGNGDGVANPGESIVLLIKDEGLYRRTELYSSNQYINPFGSNLRKSDNWSSYDHVGASAKYSVPVIAANCPENTEITFFAKYWVAGPPVNHIIKKGKITLNVSGKDQTPPELEWVMVPGNNVLRAKLYDGGKINYVKAKVSSTENPDKPIILELKDDGSGSDRAGGDRVFSQKSRNKNLGIIPLK